MTEIQIRPTGLSGVIAVRRDVLRPDDAPEVTISAVDRLPQTAHFAAFHGDTVVGVASSGPEPFPGDPTLVGWRLRGFAVYPAYRKRGIGAALLLAIRTHLIATDCEIWWAFARSGALGAYRHLGFDEYGDEFDMPPTGPHVTIMMDIASVRALRTDGNVPI